MSIETTAKLLAGEHMQDDAGMSEVFWAPAESEVRLVEVSTSIPDSGEILPFRFSPDPPDVLYPSVVIMLGPGDWKRVRARDLALPEGFGPELQKVA
jgi:hypothetical protein